MDYSKLSVREFLIEVKRGLDLRDFYGKFFQKAEALDKEYNFFVNLFKREAFNQIGGKGKLEGLPVSVKDCICVEGMETTAGSKILKGYKPPFDAHAVERIKGDGGVIVGKTQQDEFGFGTFSVNSGFGIPKNPVDPERSCGGSSGGAAGFTKAMDYPHLGMAESTGGSITCPASFCGVVGLTPTYGLVSRWGLIDYGNSLDKIGFVGREVDDVALGLETVQGFDTRDFTSLQTLKRKYNDRDVSGMRIGIPKEYFQGIDGKIKKEVMSAVDYLERQGAKVKSVSLPNTRFALASYYIIATSEASSNLSRYCGMRYGESLPIEGEFNEYFSNVRSKFFGEEAKRRIILGTFARMAGYRGNYYIKAFKVRTLVIKDFEKVFRGKNAVDVLMAPSMPITAPKFKDIEGMKPTEHYQMDKLTVGPNLAGIPQLSFPWSENKGLPIGVQILGDHLQEAKVLAVGRALEKGSKPLEMG